VKALPKIYRFTAEQHEEVKALLKKTTDVKLHVKLDILRLRMEGYDSGEISKITNYSKSRISALCSLYAQNGIAYFEKEHRAGGNHRNLTYEEERELLAPFLEAAGRGQALSASEIKAAYDSRCGHKTGSGTVYRVLKRHNITTRPK